MIDVSKIKRGDLVLAGDNHEYLCKVVEVRNDGKLTCHMFSKHAKSWVNVNLVIRPEECIYKGEEQQIN